MMEECRNGREAACQWFVDLFAARCVRRLGRMPVSSFTATTLLPVRPAADDDSWYIVPKGPHPGIYQGRLVIHWVVLDLATDRVFAGRQPLAWQALPLYICSSVKASSPLVVASWNCIWR